MELDVFRLQYCKGAVRISTSQNGDDRQFVDAYEGPNTSFVIRQLESGAPYTFRVCGRTDGASIWSPWGAHVVWSTSLPRHGLPLYDFPYLRETKFFSFHCKNTKLVLVVSCLPYVLWKWWLLKVYK